MINLKAPKDMTATEFVELFKKHRPEFRIPICEMEKLLQEPAPNPFTPDQIAWMREEQRTGMNYAYKAKNWYIFCCSEKPEMRDGDLRDLSEDHSAHKANFLTKFLEVNEFICFADYAPLE